MKIICTIGAPLLSMGEVIVGVIIATNVAITAHGALGYLGWLIEFPWWLYWTALLPPFWILYFLIKWTVANYRRCNSFWSSSK